MTRQRILSGLVTSRTGMLPAKRLMVHIGQRQHVGTPRDGSGYTELRREEPAGGRANQDIHDPVEREPG
jgi:hypothetical protein